MMVVAVCCALEGAASAQGLAASIGKAYGGDAETSAGTWAIALGGGGARMIGSEVEYAQTGHFRDLLGNEGKIVTLMAGISLNLPAGPFRPYAAFSYGVIRQNTERVTGTSVIEVSNNDGGYAVGGGLTYKFSRSAGVRVDWRHFQVRTTGGLSFQRVMVGVVLGG
jgi:opacity protein-like surface antigen